MPATDSTNPNWIDAPPPKRGGMGCLGKGCLVLVVIGLVFFLLAGFGGYLFYTHGAKPASLPIEELPAPALAEVQERFDQFEATPPAPVPAPTPVATVSPDETPEPAPPPPASEREMIVSAGEINGMISANPKSRGHAYVTLSGNTATVQMSIASDKVPGFPRGYLNGSFTIQTDGPTPVSGLQVSKIQANGVPLPSGVLSMTVGGHSIMGYALDAIAPYNVSTAEIRDGKVILH
ncbi:MAG: hypothetical protein ABI787_08005 [Spartobacteria bacterium]